MAKTKAMALSIPDPHSSCLIPLEVTLNAAQMAYLASMVADSEESEFRKVQSVILRLVEDQAAGGLMLRSDEVTRIKDSTGLDPACGADLMPFLQASTGRADGCLTCTVPLDPAYEEAVREVARVRGCDPQDIIRDMLSVGFMQEWYEHLPWQPEHVLMTKADKQGLEELLGEKFTYGTELAALVRKAVAAEGGLFGEPGPEISGVVQ